MAKQIHAFYLTYTSLSNDRRLARQVKADPLLVAYWLCLNTIESESDSKLADAVTYVKNQKSYLFVFLEHGKSKTFNDFAENEIRPIMGLLYIRFFPFCYE